MRLIYKKEKYKKFSKAVARKALKRRLKVKRKKRGERRNTLGLSKGDAREWHTKRRFKAVELAPTELAFLKNPNEVAGFITKLESIINTSPSLYVDMKKVEDIDYSTISAMLAVLYRAKKRGLKINGNMPRNLAARATLQRSGFLYTLFSKSPEAGHRYDIGVDNQMFTLDTRDLTVASEIEKEVSVCITGFEKKIPGLYTTLGELMDNTATHAGENKKENERWWLSINYDRHNSKVEFVFVDYGVGVLTSLLKKSGLHPAKTAMQKAQRIFGSDATEKLLKAIVTESARVAYKLSKGRGEGIHGIYQASKRGDISNLHIITNDAFGDVSNDKYLRLDSGLSGTLYYWDVYDKSLK